VHRELGEGFLRVMTTEHCEHSNSHRRRELNYGLIGLGKVGTNVLRFARGIKFDWVVDSRRLWRSENDKPLYQRDVVDLLKFKQKSTRLVTEEFHNAREERKLIESYMPEKDKWIVIDASHAGADVSQEVSEGLMGCYAYCCANKALWTNFALCKRIYDLAVENRTYLCLNCIQGVWVDQMEYVPLLAQNLESGRVLITKRDNSSLNLFFTRIGHGVPASDAFSELGDQGYLEPSATDLFPEIEDQWNKARITRNVCSLITKARPSRNDPVLQRKLPDGPDSPQPKDIAKWYLRKRREGGYPSLVSQVNIDVEAREVDCEMSFKVLMKPNPLARNFAGRNAIAIEAKDANFTWTSRKRAASSKSLCRNGFGGARRTAEKLLWESIRVSHLAGARPSEFYPLPVMNASKGDHYRNLVLRDLSRSL